MVGSSLLHLRLSLFNTFYYCLFPFWRTILRLCSCGSVKYVSGLAITKIYVNLKVVSVLTPFFTSHWKNITLVRAAILSNVREGLSGSALLLFTYFSDAYGCHQMVILCSSLAFIIGLVLLYLTTSQVIPQDFLLCTLVASVIGVSKSGWQPVLTGFFKGQLKSHDIQGREDAGKEDENSVQARLNMWNMIASSLAVLLTVILLPVTGWRPKLIVSAWMVGFSCLLFLCGTSKFHQIDPTITPLTIVGNVLRAAYLKRNLQYPVTPDNFFANEGNHLLLLPHLGVGRCIDKAAIIEGDPVKLEGQGRLCTATQVMETKLVLTMLPMWIIVSLGFGLVQTTGNTFFPEQANNMHSQVGMTPLLVLQGMISNGTSVFARNLLKRIPKEKRRCWMVARICLGMALYTLCFFLAWYVEVHKQRVAEKNGLQLKPNDKIPVSTWFLVPQYFLSGCAQGLAMIGVVEFYKYQVPKSMDSYGDAFHSFFNGVGSILGIACLVKFKSWFGQSLNSSRLDKYYMFIIQMCSGNFFLSSGLLVWIYVFMLSNKTIGSDTQTDLELNKVQAISDEELLLRARAEADAISSNPPDKDTDDASVSRKPEQV